MLDQAENNLTTTENTDERCADSSQQGRQRLASGGIHWYLHVLARILQADYGL